MDTDSRRLPQTVSTRPDQQRGTSAALTSIGDLVNAGLLADGNREQLEEVATRYAIAIPAAVQERLGSTQAPEPIARQFLPDPRELETLPGELEDPIGDDPHSPVPGIVHRYADRVLLKLVSICPVYCRFCFRREMIGPERGGVMKTEDLDQALNYVSGKAVISEVIMTGGDPLILSPRRIEQVTSRLSTIAHVTKLRWHTRFPVVTPELITPALIGALRSATKLVRIAIHSNHPMELTPKAIDAVRRLRDANIELLSQTVLLRGINDDVDTLADLMAAFADHGIKPYYLHHGDLAPGTSHFRTSIEHGQAIMAALKRQLPCELMPSYVLDYPGGAGKIPITTETVQPISPGVYRVSLASGTFAVYRDLLSNGSV